MIPVRKSFLSVSKIFLGMVGGDRMKKASDNGRGESGQNKRREVDVQGEDGRRKEGTGGLSQG